MNDTFDGTSSALDWQTFRSLASLLSIRNGGQVEHSSLAKHVLEEEYELDDDDNVDSISMDTTRADWLSISRHEKIKRRFLDHFAHFAAAREGGVAVTCCTMRESGESVTIWLARNEGFAAEDSLVFAGVGELLSSISTKNAQGPAEYPATLLWDEMIRYHQDRIQANYIPRLKAALTTYDAQLTGAYQAPTNILAILRETIRDTDSETYPTAYSLGILSRLLVIAYDLRRTKDLEDELYRRRGVKTASKALWLEICRLGRLHVAVRNFELTASILHSFKRVTIVIVPRHPVPEDISEGSHSLEQTLHFLELETNSAAIRAILGQKWNMSNARRRFETLQRLKPKIHAEVQMLVFLQSCIPEAPEIFPYMGCSKLSCFLCNGLLQNYGKIATRGCHGRLFSRWTVPTAYQHPQRQGLQIARALEALQADIEKRLKASVPRTLELERTSVIAGSSIFDSQHEELSRRALHIDRWKHNLERDRAVEAFSKQTADDIIPEEPAHFVFEDGESPWECDICMRQTKRKCDVCNKGYFCSTACQDKRSGPHLFTCSKRPITSADYLWEALGMDEIPSDEDVLEDFGFNKFVGLDQNFLFGVYKGLYLASNFSAEDVNEWRIAGTLVANINNFYLGRPEEYRGQYFPWFQKNLHIFESPSTKDDAAHAFMRTMHDAAIPYLEIEDRNMPVKDLVPEAKAFSFRLLARILFLATPNPIEVDWYIFGFVTCRNEIEEAMLVDFYRRLLTKRDAPDLIPFNRQREMLTEPVTFTQFWQAPEAGTLIELSEGKGVRYDRSHLPFLKDFLSKPAHDTRPPVWDLKHFLEVNDMEKYPPTASVHVDYGFVNCRTFVETCTLIEIYKKLLQTTNALDLHQACTSGKLFEFASKHMRMSEEWASLMRNPYPLDQENESASELGPFGDTELSELIANFWKHFAVSRD